MSIADTFYRKVARPALFACNPEIIHDLFIVGGQTAGALSPVRSSISHFYGYKGPDISKTVDGVKYELPVLLSAGFDPDGKLTRILKSVSFGGEEIGSTTAKGCKGNPRPRLTRLIKNDSIVVNKGLRNHGVDALIKNLKRTPRTPGYVLGISIARTNMAEACIDVEAGIKDFCYSFKRLNEENVGDYYTINISCPNTFDGEGFADPKNLRPLLPRLREIPCAKPVYLKMPINPSWEVFNELCQIADENKIQGLIIGNLNKNYSELKYPDEVVHKNIKKTGAVYQTGVSEQYRGGLSGRPCFERSNELIRKTREAWGNRFTIIGVGGVMSPEDAMVKFDAGADLIMLITGMIFGSPSLMHDICVAYSERQKKNA